MSSFTSMHVEGGMEFMLPQTILGLINLGLFIYVLMRLLQKKTINSAMIEGIKHLGTIILAYGAWGTAVGFFQMFDAIEATKEVLPIQVISGGVKVALLNVLYGLFIFFLSMIAYLITRLMNQQVATSNH